MYKQRELNNHDMKINIQLLSVVQFRNVFLDKIFSCIHTLFCLIINSYTGCETFMQSLPYRVPILCFMLQSIFGFILYEYILFLQKPRLISKKSIVKAL